VILVEIRCKVRGCGALLATVTAVPPPDTQWTPVPVCRYHGRPWAGLLGLPMRLARARGARWQVSAPVSTDLIRDAIRTGQPVLFV
jgi:hypothetical protein